MKKCRICGHVSEGERRCPVCHTDVSALPEWREAELHDESLEERYKCCKCGRRNKPDAVSCDHCGAILVSAPVQIGCPERPALCLQITDGRQILIPYGGGLVGRCYLGETELKDDPYISRKHVRIIPHEAGYLLELLSSANGAFINSHEVKVGQRVPIKHGDRIRLGYTELSVLLSSSSDNKERIVLM